MVFRGRFPARLSPAVYGHVANNTKEALAQGGGNDFNRQLHPIKYLIGIQSHQSSPQETKNAAL